MRQIVSARRRGGRLQTPLYHRVSPRKQILFLLAVTILLVHLFGANVGLPSSSSLGELMEQPTRPLATTTTTTTRHNNDNHADTMMTENIRITRGDITSPITSTARREVTNNDDTTRTAIKETTDFLHTSTSTTTTTNSTMDAIPHRMIVVETRYTGVNSIPEPYRSNVKNTIRVYKDHWGENMEILFIGKEACESVVAKTQEELLPYYHNEPFGAYKADICRYATLYLHGGYYFDNDMVAIKPVQVAPTTTFVSPWQWGRNGIFNSFIAVAPRHPILHKTLESVLGHYRDNLKFKTNIMGTGALLHGYEMVVADKRRGAVGQEEEIALSNKEFDMDLVEILMTKETHPNFPRLDGRGCCCDIVVHNDTTGEIFFYSHMVGKPGTHTCGPR